MLQIIFKQALMGTAEYYWFCSGSSSRIMQQNRTICPCLRASSGIPHQQYVRSPYENPMARRLDSSRFFHGHWGAAERSIRAWALLHNFGHYCPRSKISDTYFSPAHKLNGFVYHQNWLHNLLISTSMSGNVG